MAQTPCNKHRTQRGEAEKPDTQSLVKTLAAMQRGAKESKCAKDPIEEDPQRFWREAPACSKRRRAADAAKEVDAEGAAAPTVAVWTSVTDDEGEYNEALLNERGRAFFGNPGDDPDLARARLEQMRIENRAVVIHGATCERHQVVDKKGSGC